MLWVLYKISYNTYNTYNTYKIFIIFVYWKIVMTSHSQHITLSELQQRIKQAVEGALPLPVWVVAEVSELKVNYSGHCYLELVEKSEPARGGTPIPRAQVRAVIWRQQYAMLSAYFKAETGSALTAGMKILAKVIVSYHELYGLSLQITAITTLSLPRRYSRLTLQTSRLERSLLISPV